MRAVLHATFQEVVAGAIPRPCFSCIASSRGGSSCCVTIARFLRTVHTCSTSSVATVLLRPSCPSLSLVWSERALRERPGVRLLFAGRMEAMKGGMVLLDALPQIVHASGCPVHLTFAGDGIERSSWEARARALTAETPGLVIDFTGWVPAEQIRALLLETDLLVLPSVWPEPFGSIGPEAAGHGVPAAAFDVGGVSQWLRDGVTGHLALADPPSVDGLAKAVIRCLESRAL